MDRFEVLLQSRSIIGCKCISKLAQSRRPSASLSSLNLGLQLHLQPRSIVAWKCISQLAWSRLQSASPNSLDYVLQVHLSTRSIMASKFILNQRRQVYGDTGVQEVDWATGSTYSGHPGVDRHDVIFFSSGSSQLRGFSRPGSIICSHFLRWALCLLALSFPHNGLQVVHL